MSKSELRLQFLKLEQEGYGINSRCNLYNFGADNYQEFPAWKYRVNQFATNHLMDHPYYQQLANSLSIKRDRINDFSDILRDMNVIGKDDEYWQEQGQQMPMVSMYNSTPMQPLVLCQEKAHNKVSDDIEKGRRQGCGKRGKGP